jgi:uroporphyrinogen-III synthase
MANPSLRNLHIVVTRPTEQAQSLCDAIRHHGGFAAEFPLLAIAPLENYQAFEQAITELEQADWAIFISSNAVANAMPRVLKRYGAVPEGVNFAAIGHQTAKELALYGVHNVLIPHTRFDSETLLALPEMQAVANKTIMIFRGVGGRDVLAETLKSRGAKVIFAESYQRINPQINTTLLDQLWQHGKLDALVVTSSEAMRHLLHLAVNAEWLQHVTLCVNHARIAELPQQHGLKVRVANAPGDEAMLTCLSQLVSANDN